MDLEEQAEKAEEAGNLEVALRLWREAAAIQQTAVSFCRYGQVAVKLDEWDEAEGAFSKALRLEPNLSLAMESMGDLWATRTDKDPIECLTTAKDWFLRALGRERSARVLTFLGSTYVALETLEEARNAFEEAIKIDSNYEEALYNLAILEEKQNPQRSIELLEKAIQIDPKYSMAHQALGRLHQRSKDLPRAEYHFRHSLVIDPADYWANLYLANVLSAQGKNAEAEQIYRLTTSLHPEITGGLDLFASFLESIGKYEQATSVREKARASQ